MAPTLLEVKKAYKEIDNERIQFFMKNFGGDLVRWIRNPSAASFMGGVWERQNRSVQAILSFLLSKHGKSLDKEFLLTLAAETEGMLNSPSLTVENISGPTSDLCLAP